jgi:hypothetical protein
MAHGGDAVAWDRLGYWERRSGAGDPTSANVLVIVGPFDITTSMCVNAWNELKYNGR